jgi:hypothetical protein
MPLKNPLKAAQEEEDEEKLEHLSEAGVTKKFVPSASLWDADCAWRDTDCTTVGLIAANLEALDSDGILCSACVHNNLLVTFSCFERLCEIIQVSNSQLFHLIFDAGFIFADSKF